MKPEKRSQKEPKECVVSTTTNHEVNTGSEISTDGETCLTIYSQITAKFELF